MPRPTLTIKSLSSDPIKQPKTWSIAQQTNNQSNSQPVSQSTSQIDSRTSKASVPSYLFDASRLPVKRDQTNSQTEPLQSKEASVQQSSRPSVTESASSKSFVQSVSSESDDEDVVEIEVIDDDDEMVVPANTLLSLKPLPSRPRSVASVDQPINNLSISHDDDEVPPVPAGTLLSLKPIGAVRQPVVAPSQSTNNQSVQPSTANQQVKQTATQSSSSEDEKDYILYLKRVPIQNQTSDVLSSPSNSASNAEQIVGVRLSMLSPSERAAYQASQKPSQSLPARLAARKTWLKFGDCTGIKPRSINQFDPISGALVNLRAIELNDVTGQQSNQNSSQSGNQWTLVGQEFELDLHPQVKGGEVAKRAAAVTCSKCGGAHFSLHCSKQSSNQPANHSTMPSNASTSTSVAPPARPSKYVPPSRRSATTTSDVYVPQRQPQIRINGLPSHTTEGDVKQLCASFGSVTRVFLDKQRRGWAFVSFSSPRDARAAAERLDGHRYGGAVLNANFVDSDQPPRTSSSYQSQSSYCPTYPQPTKPTAPVNKPSRSVYEDEGRIDDVIAVDSVVKQKQPTTVSNKAGRGKAREFVDFGI